MKINTGQGTIPLITLIGIWSVSALTSLPGLAVSPILGELSTIFPHATELDIQMLTSLPSLLIIPFVLLAGKLAEKRDFIRLLRVGLWLFAASGVLYLFSSRMWQLMYNPQIQISAESETKRSIFREKDKTKRSKKESAQHSKSRNKSFVMTSVSAL